MSDRPDAEVAVDDDEHVEEGDCCPFASPAVNLALLSAFCRWPPRPSSGKQIVGGAFERAVPTLLTFIDATLVFLISRQWWDLLSVRSRLVQ